MTSVTNRRVGVRIRFESVENRSARVRVRIGLSGERTKLVKDAS